MTVELATTILNWVGLSGDSKPATAPPGSTFYETDTGATYIFAAGAWGFDIGRSQGMLRATKTVAFTGAAGAGAIGAVAVFDITGRVLVHYFFPRVTEDLVSAGGGSIACGDATDTDGFAPTATATNLDANEWWTGANPAGDVNTGLLVSHAGGAVTSQMDKACSLDIILTVTVGDVTDGTIIFDVLWRPLSANGLLVPA